MLPTIFAAFVLCFLLERARPGWRLPVVRGWWWRVFAINGAQLGSNYGDITWWDMLFGTCENPARFTATCGFDDARGQRLGDMLRWRDVHRG